MLAMIKGLWNYDYINGLLLRHENTIWKRFGGETTLEIWWEGQASNYYILSWAIRNKVKKIYINVIGNPNVNGYPMLMPLLECKSSDSYEIRHKSLCTSKKEEKKEKIKGWLIDGKNWPSGRSLIATGHSKIEVIDCVRLGMYLHSMGKAVNIKIHPHYKRRHKRLVNKIIESYGAKSLIVDGNLEELLEASEQCYCNLDSVGRAAAKLGKICIPIISNKYPTFMEKPNAGQGEVDMSEEIPSLGRIEENSGYDVPYRLTVE